MSDKDSGVSVYPPPLYFIWPYRRLWYVVEEWIRRAGIIVDHLTEGSQFGTYTIGKRHSSEGISFHAFMSDKTDLSSRGKCSLAIQTREEVHDMCKIMDELVSGLLLDKEMEGSEWEESGTEEGGNEVGDFRFVYLRTKFDQRNALAARFRVVCLLTCPEGSSAVTPFVVTPPAYGTLAEKIEQTRRGPGLGISEESARELALGLAFIIRDLHKCNVIAAGELDAERLTFMDSEETKIRLASLLKTRRASSDSLIQVGC